MSAGRMTLFIESGFKFSKKTLETGTLAKELICSEFLHFEVSVF